MSLLSNVNSLLSDLLICMLMSFKKFMWRISNFAPPFKLSPMYHLFYKSSSFYCYQTGLPCGWSFDCSACSRLKQFMRGAACCALYD
ncbi:uncharacterized protein LOC127107670 isoform X4 [Lathyrus oleraceus]|uniref:uncharacterized protein LOC127107670 isoform X4 n=1 Tax=Pisum sativum TaxID=3888 RepID=UPI0021CE1D58|nr:uncharacterized protein LOC127107670 isoform X4 [Pisum sativum]